MCNCCRISNSRRFGDGAGIKWLVLPWQPLVASDRAVLAAVEESLVNSVETTLIVHTCRFVTNVMLQDFPAEVFLQRPAIVLVRKLRPAKFVEILAKFFYFCSR